VKSFSRGALYDIRITIEVVKGHLRLRLGECFDASKGQCHKIFDFMFSTIINFPQAPDYTIRDVSDFSENLQI
jgi:hypothetical protein